MRCWIFSLSQYANFINCCLIYLGVTYAFLVDVLEIVVQSYSKLHPLIILIYCHTHMYSVSSDDGDFDTFWGADCLHERLLHKFVHFVHPPRA